VKATSGAVNGTATVTVPAAVATTVTVAPATATVAAGATTTLTATVKDQNGQPMPSAAVTWTVTPTGVVTLTPNGQSVTVTGSAAGTATVTATSGAVNGTASVTVPTPPSQAPIITGFSPTIGVAGTVVTLSGLNFAPTPANDQLTLNTRSGLSVTGATATSLTTTIPAATGSGRFSLTTPSGTALSSADFFVAPSPYTAADVQFTARTGFGDTVITISTANKIGLVTFDGTAGRQIAIRVSNSSIASGSLSVRQPDGVSLASVGFTNQGFLDSVTLPMTGTYTLMIDPNSTSVGSLTTSLYDVPPDVSGTIVPGGSDVTVTVATPGQNIGLTFSAASGQRVSLKASNSTIASGALRILKPDGTTLGSSGFSNLGGFLDALTIPATGTYTVQVDPNGTNIGSTTLTLYDVPPDVSGTIVPGGSDVTVAVATPGQNVGLTFSAASGQRVSLKASNSTIASGVLRILKPDGTTLGSSGFTNPGGFLDALTIPVTGTYTVQVDPNGTNIGSITLTLSDVPPDVTGPIVAGGPSVTVNLTASGQNARLTFSGTTGQRVSLKATGTTISSGVIGVLKPDGSTLTTTGLTTSGAFIDVQTLTLTGTYVVFVDPNGTNIGSTTLTLYTVPADLSGALTIGGAGAALTIGTPGQNGVFTFSGTAGQQVTVRVTGNTIATVAVKLLKPDGTQLTSSTSGASSFNLSTQTLPVSGTYTVVVDPTAANIGSLTVTATSP
jgi:hypothetical protein